MFKWPANSPNIILAKFSCYTVPRSACAPEAQKNYIELASYSKKKCVYMLSPEYACNNAFSSFIAIVTLLSIYS